MLRYRRTILSALVLGAVCALGAAGAVPGHAARPAVKTVSVKIQNFAFSPRTITIHVGTRVTWTNRDAVQHTVTATRSGAVLFDSNTMQQGAHYSRTFKTVGTFQYHCSYHPYMTGKVKVIR